MDAKELRSGITYVNYTRKGETRLIQTSVNDISIIDAGKIPHSTWYNPIPLTEDWLIKFGFQYDYEGNLFLEPIHDDTEANFYFHWEVDELVLRDSFEDVFMSRLNYVHQLQNLYFALTGEELTIKEQ